MINTSLEIMYYFSSQDEMIEIQVTVRSFSILFDEEGYDKVDMNR